MEEDGFQIDVDAETRKRYAYLYVAALKGDWSKAEEIFEEYPGDVRAELSDVGDTVLHVAVAAGENDFLKKLMVSKYMEKVDLKMKNKEGNTAFSIAAMSGDTKLTESMLEKNHDLAMIRGGGDEMLPVLVAALLGHEKMASYLYEATKQNLTEDDRIELLVTLIESDLYDVAFDMVRDFPVLAVSRRKVYQKENGKAEEIREKVDQNKKGKKTEEVEKMVDQKENGKTEEIGETALHALARKPLICDDFDKSKQGILKRYYYQLSETNKMQNKPMQPKALELVRLLWDEVVNRLKYKQISELIEKPQRLIFDAVKEGNIDFLSIIFSKRPDLIFKLNEEKHSIFHTAVSYRHENIFKCIDKLPSIKNVIVALEVGERKNNILHLAAELPLDQNRLEIVSGAALQMQRELWCFEEVRKLMPPAYFKAKNGEGKTARTLFTERHKNLMKAGEEWMKKTAESCMLVATLIATVGFAAAFTVPGGLNNDTGVPIFVKKASFITFAIFDTISLVLSACSIITFLSILTARYAEEDFLWFLPTMLLFGLSTLLVSIAGMMVVFCTTLFIVFIEGTLVPVVLGIALACIPVMLFILQQKRLISDVFELICEPLFLEIRNIK